MANSENIRTPQGVDPVTQMLALAAINRMKSDPEWAEFWIHLASSYLRDNGREATTDAIGDALGDFFIEYARNAAPFMTLWRLFKEGVRKFSAKPAIPKPQRS